MEAFFKNNSLLKPNINEINNKNQNESKENRNTTENFGENNSLIKTNINIIKTKNIKDNKDEKKIHKEKSLEKIKDNNKNYCNLKKTMKSQYIIKQIFLNLNNRRKLLMIRYNKYYNEL